MFGLVPVTMAARPATSWLVSSRIFDAKQAAALPPNPLLVVRRHGAGPHRPDPADRAAAGRRCRVRAIGPEALEQMVEPSRIEGDGVEELPGVFGRTPWGARTAGVGSCPVEAREQQRAAAVVEDDLEQRMTLEHAAEHEENRREAVS
jgi:hypothetical protein